jgi:hypothetical protein
MTSLKNTNWTNLTLPILPSLTLPLPSPSLCFDNLSQSSVEVVSYFQRSFALYKPACIPISLISHEESSRLDASCITLQKTTLPSAFTSGSAAVSLSADVHEAQQALLRIDVDRSSGKRRIPFILVCLRPLSHKQRLKAMSLSTRSDIASYNFGFA